MRVVGIAETLELIDGSAQLPTLRFLRDEQETTCLAAPAMATAAASIVEAYMDGEISEPEYRRLTTRIEAILDQTEPEPTGLYQMTGPAFGNRRPFKLLASSRAALRRLPLVLNATRAMPLDPGDAQVFAIAIAEDASLLLLDTEYNREQFRRACEGGLIVDVVWIPVEDGPPA